MGCCGSNPVEAEEHLDYSAGNVTIIPDLKSWEEKLEDASELGKTLVVKFSAVWCGPCRIAAPVYAELSLKHYDLVFVSVDVDELPVHKCAEFCSLIFLSNIENFGTNVNTKSHFEMIPQELVEQFDIHATPTFIFISDKKEIDKLVGGNQADLETKFEPYCRQSHELMQKQSFDDKIT